MPSPGFCTVSHGDFLSHDNYDDNNDGKKTTTKTITKKTTIRKTTTMKTKTSKKILINFYF